MKSIKVIFLLCFVVALFNDAVIISQEFSEATPTPFSPILIQANPNTGNIQPFAMSAVAVRTGIRSWQDAGWTGRGIRVGVLDRGFGQIAHFESVFGLTADVALGDDKIVYDASPIIHGTQVLETIHAVAPGARLYACQYDTLDKFAQCIDWMISSGVQIINHSAGVPAFPLDGSSRWSRQVDRAAQANILWVNSAGNFAQGYYTDILTDTNINKLHEFRGNAGVVEALGVSSLENDVTGVVMLSWLDYNNRSANEIDIDLQVIDASTGEVIVASRNSQSGFPNDQALEYLSFNMNRPFAVQIIDNSGNAAGVRFALFVEFAQLPGGEEQRSIIAPGDSINALTVGALQGINLAPYSSRGPLATGAIKPDLTAPGEVELADGTWFVGTSAASPVVAGSAALIWEANPDYSAQSVRTFLLNATQDDDQILGNDINYGNGRLYMPLPLGTRVAPTPTETIASTETPEPNLTNTPTPTTQPTRTVAPSSTPEPTVSVTGNTATVNVEVANLREGPGTNYNLAGTATGGTELPILARTNDSDWYLVEQGNGERAWIWSGIVNLNIQVNTIEVVATIPIAPAIVATTSTSESGFGAPTLISPANGQTSDIYPRTVQLQWNSVPGATSYEVIVEVCFVASARDRNLDTCAHWLSQTVEATSFTFNFVGAQPGRWLVRAIAQDGSRSLWSERRVFYFTR